MTEREAFETLLRYSFRIMERQEQPPNDYIEPDIQEGWELWQERGEWDRREAKRHLAAY